MLDKVVPKEHMTQSIQELHLALMQYLQLQLSGQTSEPIIQEHATKVKDQIVELSQFMQHLRQMEALKFTARELS